MPLDDKPKNLKKNLPSRHTTVGPERAPHRSYLYAMGVTEAEIYQPLVGVPIVPPLRRALGARRNVPVS